MSNIIPFGDRKKPKHTKKNTKTATPPASGGNIMCRNNHHKWRIDQSQKFDTKTGKLITVEICERCQKRRHRLT